MNPKERKISYLSVSVLELDPDLPRQFFGEEKLKEISNSIKEKGVLQPLLVRPMKNKPGKYSVVMGKRRLRGALLAGSSEVPCVIENVEDKEALEMALTENIQRDDLTPFEEAWGILKLMKDYGYSAEEVAKKIGKGQKFINLRLQLLSLPAEIQRYVAKGELGITEAASLVSLTPQKQLEAVKEITSGSLSRDQIKEVILRKVEESKGKWVKSREKTALHKIKLMIKNLTELLRTFKADEISYGERREIEIVLSELRKAIDKTIAEMKNI